MHNVGNRPMQNKRVNQYAADMLAGRWILTHQGIAFDCEGNLIDGQHRLQAVVRSGKAVYMVVAYNVPRGNMANPTIIDGGQGRNLIQQMKMNGITETELQASAQIAKRYLGIFLTDMKASSTVPLEYVNMHRDEFLKCFEIVQTRNGKKTMAVPVIVAAAIYMALRSGEPVEGLRAFVDAYKYDDYENTVYGIKHAVRLREEAHTGSAKPALDIITSRLYAFLHNYRACVVKPDYYPQKKLKLVDGKLVEVDEETDKVAEGTT